MQVFIAGSDIGGEGLTLTVHRTHARAVDALCKVDTRARDALTAHNAWANDDDEGASSRVVLWIERATVDDDEGAPTHDSGARARRYAEVFTDGARAFDAWHDSGAHDSGAPAPVNPYAEGSDDAHAWRAGFDDGARDEARRNA